MREGPTSDFGRGIVLEDAFCLIVPVSPFRVGMASFIVGMIKRCNRNFLYMWLLSIGPTRHVIFPSIHHQNIHELCVNFVHPFHKIVV